MSNPSNHKYRPVLTQDQITHILSLCRKDMSDASIQLMSVLAPFEYKIRNQAITPAYTQTPKESLADMMGLEPTPPIPSIRSLDPKALYEVWVNDPSFPFTPSDLRIIREYRYVNDLMTFEEERAYETNAIDQANQSSSI